MPCYNSERFIKDAIKSILGQTFQDFQFIIINDGSTDSTDEIILSVKDPRILYKKKEHTGISETLNYGIKLAKTELIARMDSDDISLPFRLDIEYEFALKNKIYDVISCWYAVFQNNKIKYIVKTKENSDEIKKSLLLYSEICHPAALMKKSAIVKLGGYKPLYQEDVFQDYELWLKGKEQLAFYNIQRVLLFQRYTDNSLSKKNLLEKFKLHYRIQEPFYTTENIKLFGLKNNLEEMDYRGWREYFYGDTYLARKFWLQLGINLFKRPRILIAFFLSFLPPKIIIKIKNISPRYRSNYLLHYYSKISKSTRNYFKLFIKDYRRY